MSDSGGSSSDLSELQEGVGLRSDTGSDDAGADSEPDTEAETERLDPSPQKARGGVAAPEVEANETEGAATPHTEGGQDAARPGLTAQDLLGDHDATSASEDDEARTAAATTSSRSHIKSPPEVAGRKRKRSGSVSPLANGKSADGEPLKKRSSSTRNDRKSADATKSALGLMRDAHEEAIVSSADEGRDAPEPNDDGTPGLAADGNAEDEIDHDVAEVDPEAGKEDFGELSDAVGDDDGPVNEAVEEEDAEPDNEVEPDEAEADEGEAEAEATAKSEDELAKKKVAMEALVPIEKLFAVFRDRLFDERWAQLSAELEVLNAPDTTHPDYLAMRQALDARKEEKLNLEHATLGYKIKALENKILSTRAQIHGQYFQSVRKIREEYIEKLNEQFSRIQRERRQWKTKEPHFIYKYDPKRSKQIAFQTAYNKEVSLLSGIAKHVGFPGAPEIHGASSNDVEEDLRAMNIQPQGRPVSYSARIASSARADEAAAEEQFLEKTPWANPQHPSHQQALAMDRKAQDASRAAAVTPSARMVDIQHRGVAGSASTAAANSDPPLALGQSQSDTIVNGSSPLEQMKRKDATYQPLQDNSKDGVYSNANDSKTDSATLPATGPTATIPQEHGLPQKAASNGPIESLTPHQPFETPASGNPSFGPVQSASYGTLGGEQPQSQEAGRTSDQDGPEPRELEREQADRRFAPPPPASGHEGIAAGVGVGPRAFGVR